MANRQRDYKAEYARRKAKAQRQGFSGYSHKRRLQQKSKRNSERISERVIEFFSEYMADDGDIFDDTLFWEAFRNYYGKGTPA